MALTLTQYEYLATDEMKKGIMKAIILVSPVLQRLPFITITGNSYLYNIETAEAGVQWATVGAIINESPPTYVQRTTALANLIGDADVDAFMQQTRTNEQDLTTAIIELKAKAIAYEFDKQFVWGGTTTTAPTYCFDGLVKIIAERDTAGITTVDLDSATNDQVVSPGASHTKNRLALMDELIDAVKPGRPDMLMMSRMTRRYMNTLLRASGSGVVTTMNNFGQPVQMWGDVPIGINDFIGDNINDGDNGHAWSPASHVLTVTRTAGVNASPVFAIKFGEDALHGLQNLGIQTEPIGTLETKDAKRTRIKWYCGMAMPGPRSCAVLINVGDTE